MSAAVEIKEWDHDQAYALYCLGLPTEEIGVAVGVTGRAIRYVAQADKWEERREKWQQARAERFTKHISKEQEFIRQTECSYARRLFGMAEMEIRLWKPGKATLLDMTRLLDVASRLGRLGSGLPLNQVEVTQTYDLGENLMQAIERAYSDAPAKEPKLIEVAPPDAGTTA
jgi:hypothetical protein